MSSPVAPDSIDLGQLDSGDGVVVTGSSDPFSLRVSYKQPLLGREEVVVLCVSCCNLTNLSLSDFEIHIRPLGAVKCVDGLNDLKLRLLQAGSASGNLPSFGVFRGEKRFQLQKFTQVQFFFQVVFNEIDASCEGDDAAQVVPIRLSPSEKFVVHFDALFRLPKQQFATGAFFQRCWQGAEASCLVPIESTARSGGDGNGDKVLSFCQRLVKHCNAHVAIIRDLLIDTPIQIHIAFLTETRWDEFVAASVTLTCSTSPNSSFSGGSSANPSAASAQSHWSGVLELRSTSATVHEFAKAPQDALTASCESCQLQTTTSDASNIATMGNAQMPCTESQSDYDTVRAGDSGSGSAFSTPPMDFPSVDFTKSAGDRASSGAKWALTPFDQAFDSPDQLRPASSATTDPWF